jgi:hypothetical protein
MKKKYFFLFFLLFSFTVFKAFSASYVSIASGSWTDPSVWSLPWVNAPVPPGSGQPVVISAGTTINGTTGGTFTLDVAGTLIFYGDYSNSSGGLTIENGGVMIVTGNMTTSSALTINGTGELKILGNLTESGGSITLNNSAILDVGQTFTEGWQSTNLYNNATILVVQNYNVNGNMNENGSGTTVAVLGTVTGGGCSGCTNSMAPTNPAWIFWTSDVPNYWTGSTSTNWSTTSNWMANVVPSSGATVQFANPAVNDLQLDADRTIGNLTNMSSKKVIIPPGICLTVNGTITTNNDPNQIYIQSSSSGASGSLIFHNAYGSPVQATVEMYSLASWNLTNAVGGRYKWQFFGVPVRLVSSASPLFDGAYVREMHENDSPLHWNQLNNASSLTSFDGYEITQSAGKTYVFQGALENSDYSVTEPFTSVASYPGETLIGNSYTAAIDIKKIVFGSQMLATVYLYNTGTKNDWIANGQITADSTNTLPGQYTAVPSALAGTGTLPGQIPSMQAFLVRSKMSSGSATVSIPYSTATTVIKNTTLQRTASTINSADSTPVWTQIDVKGSQFSDRMWIFTEPNCTHGYDNGYDGEKFIGSYVSPQIYALETDGIYQVNSVDDMNNTYLGFQRGEDSLYTLTFTHHNVKSKYNNVYLVDSVAQTTTDITAGGSTYTFYSLSTDTIIKRFKIVTTVNLTTKLKQGNSPDSVLNVFSSNQTVFIDNKSDTNGTLRIYDVAGRMIQTYPFNANVITTLRTMLPQGSYLAVAITGKDRVTTKLILH